MFRGGRPYKETTLENMLKGVFGDDTKLIPGLKCPPRTMVTGVVADCMPADFHLFRNYDIPGAIEKPDRQKGTQFELLPSPRGILSFPLQYFHYVNALWFVVHFSFSFFK